MARPELLGGLIQVYRRTGRYSIGGRQHRVSTGEEDLTLAKQFAEDWFIELRGKSRAGHLHLHASDGGRRYLSGRQELPDFRRDD